MKKTKMVFIILSIALLITTVIGIAILPDHIVLSYDALGYADCMRTKYELFIPLGCVALITVILELMTRKNNEISRGDKTTHKDAQKIKIYYLIGIVFLGIQIFLTMFIMVSTLLYTKNFKETALNNCAIGLLIGSILLIGGFVIKRVKRNALIGLRTIWSLKNDKTWEKSQNFSAGVLLLMGIVIIFLTSFVDIITPFEFYIDIVMIIVLVGTIVCIVQSKIVYDKYGTDESTEE